MKWTPKNDQVFVRPLLPPGQTTGGLIIPDDARGRPQRGVILAVGPGPLSELTGKRGGMQCRVGELVLFGGFAGLTEEIDGEAVIIMRDMEALGGVAPMDFGLIEHVDPRGKTLWHLDSETCEHCEPEATPALDEERARFRARVAAESNASDLTPEEQARLDGAARE